MRDIHPSKLIQSEMFVSEPVNQICRDIEKLDIERTILLGKGTGKSVLLEYLKEKTAANENPFLLAKLDPLRFSSNIETNSIYTDEFMRHCCEEQMAFQILWYIKNYYECTYHTHFTKYSDYLHESNEKTIQYINESVFEEQAPLKNLLSTQEMVGEILKQFKKFCYVDNIRLGIDRFDRILSKRAQHIFSEYFPLFSNCIIAVDDETLPNEWYQTYFKENSMLYTFAPLYIDYGKNIEVVRLIFKKRIENYNKFYTNNENFKFFKPFSENFFTNEILKLIIDSTNGNISMMLGILRNLANEWQWSERLCLIDVEKAIEECKGQQLVLKKMDGNPPKLYL